MIFTEPRFDAERRARGKTEIDAIPDNSGVPHRFGASHSRPMQRERLPILVTGSSGLIGSAVMRRLAQRYEVDGVSRHRNPDLPGSWIGVDMTDVRSVASALDELHAAHGSRLASVIHLAAYYDFSGAPSPR